MKEYYKLYYWNGTEWLFTAQFDMVDDRVHYSMIQEMSKIQNLGYQFKFEYFKTPLPILNGTK